MLTETGKLPIGVVIEGVRHQEFELRGPTIEDNINATLECETSSGLEVSSAIYARQLVRLGTLPPETIDLAFMLKLNPMDYNAIERADEELRKKLMRDGSDFSGGPTVAPISPDTASAKP